MLRTGSSPNLEILCTMYIKTIKVCGNNLLRCVKWPPNVFKQNFIVEIASLALACIIAVVIVIEKYQQKVQYVVLRRLYWDYEIIRVV